MLNTPYETPALLLKSVKKQYLPHTHVIIASCPHSCFSLNLNGQLYTINNSRCYIGLFKVRKRNLRDNTLGRNLKPY